MRPWQVPLAVHWDLEPGRVELLLRQEVGNHLPWLELALALVVLLALADGRLLMPGAGVAAGAIAVGYFYETHAAKRRPALIRLNWEAQEAELTYNDGRTVRTALKEPCYAHPVKLRLTASRQGFATAWEKPDGAYILVRHKNRSESSNFLRDLAQAGWPVYREEMVL